MNAISIANEFIKRAKAENYKTLTPLKLMKLTYIAYGFGLAFGVKMIDPRFNKVEAWKYGPVIPSVYHTFKHFVNNNVTELGVVLKDENENGECVKEVPMFSKEEEDGTAGKIIDLVWKRYKILRADELVTILHAIGSPWQKAYRAGENVEIPENFTERHYDRLVTLMIKNAKRRRAELPVA